MGILEQKISGGECTLYHDYRSGTFRDFSGNGNHGVGTDAVLIGNGLQATSLTEGYVKVPDCTIFDSNKYGTYFVLVEDQHLGQYLTFCEFKTDSGNRVLFYTGNSGNNYRLGDGTTNSFKVSDNSGLRSNCVVFGDGELADFYSDGSLVGDANTTVSFANDMGNGDFYVGTVSTTSVHCNATIQAVVACKTKLTAGEISQLHDELLAKKWPTKVITNTSKRSLIDTTKTGLVSAYDFKNGSLDDLVGSNDGTQFGSVDFFRSRLGTSLYNQANGVINLGKVADSSPFFISMWVKWDGLSACWLFGKYLNSTNSWRLRIGLTGGINIFDDIGNAGAWVYEDALLLQPGVWSHVVVGLDSTDVNKVWLDANPAANNISSSSGLDSFSTDLAIGDLRPSQLDLGFNGSVSNIEIFNTDLTDSDVEAIYNRGKNIVSYFDNGVTASENTFSSGFIENTPIEVQSGSFKVVNDGSGSYLECVSDGIASLPTGIFGSSPKELIYGSFEFYLYTVTGSYSKYISFMSEGNGAYNAQPNYHMWWKTAGDMVIRYLTAPDFIDSSPSTFGVDTFHKFNIIRPFSETFSLYVNDTLVGSGSDTRAFESKYMCFDLNSGDRLGLTGAYRMWWSPIVQEP